MNRWVVADAIETKTKIPNAASAFFISLLLCAVHTPYEQRLQGNSGKPCVFIGDLRAVIIRAEELGGVGP
jgi:hypothetical protein